MRVSSGYLLFLKRKRFCCNVEAAGLPCVRAPVLHDAQLSFRSRSGSAPARAQIPPSALHSDWSERERGRFNNCSASTNLLEFLR